MEPKQKEDPRKWSEDPNMIQECELQWMLKKKPLVFDPEQISKDYADPQLLPQFESEEYTKKFLPCLAWHGVGTRWRQFYSWLKSVEHTSPPADPETAFRQFANFLGRVTSYRALSLIPSEFDTISRLNSIWPTGRLKSDETTIDQIVKEKGAKFICYARLYIGLGLIPTDPSLSLHDDPETAVCIASGYMNLKLGRKVHLMKLSVPLIEVCGYRVADVQSKPEVWFDHRGIWFNATWERTERYTFYEIPFLKERLMELKIFHTRAEVVLFLEPFAAKQEKIRKEDENAQEK